MSAVSQSTKKELIHQFPTLVNVTQKTITEQSYSDALNQKELQRKRKK